MRRFWRGLVIFLLGGVLGTGFGVALGFFVYPFVFPPPAAMDQLGAADSEARSRPAPSSTPIRPTRSTGARARSRSTSAPCSSSRTSRSGPGPAFHVYLVPKAGIRKNSDLGDAMFVDLGGLRAFKGSQRYAIPAGVDLKNYQSVIIWCRQFSVLISPADLVVK